VHIRAPHTQQAQLHSWYSLCYAAHNRALAQPSADLGVLHRVTLVSDVGVSERTPHEVKLVLHQPQARVVHCGQQNAAHIGISFRVGQNHAYTVYICIYVYTVFLAGKSPGKRSHTVCKYGSGQP